MTSCSWPLGNGSKIDLTIYRLNTRWNSVGGLYVFTYKKVNGHWKALYIGQTDDLSSGLSSHERLNEAIDKGATHIHAIAISSQSDREKYERMLIAYLQPPMNSQPND